MLHKHTHTHPNLLKRWGKNRPEKWYHSNSEITKDIRLPERFYGLEHFKVMWQRGKLQRDWPLNKENTARTGVERDTSHGAERKRERETTATQSLPWHHAEDSSVLKCRPISETQCGMVISGLAHGTSSWDGANEQLLKNLFGFNLGSICMVPASSIF